MSKLFRTLLAAASFAPLAAYAQSWRIVAQPQTPVEANIIHFLEGSLKAGGVVTEMATQANSAPHTVVVGTPEQMPLLLTPAQLRVWRRGSKPIGAEGFSVVPLHSAAGTSIVLSAERGRGELFAIGWLLRSASWSHGRMRLPQTSAFTSKPDRAVRGYQVGYRMKNNTYDAWTLEQFRRQMLDMAVFGLNTMQVVAPVSDDDPSSPLFPAPAEATVIGLSKMSQDFDLRFDLFYPEMAKDYADPKQMEAELRQFEDLVRKMPLLDSIHIPGGDPGHTGPEYLLPLVEKEAAILHRYHPRARVWLSVQGFTAERYKQFYSTMRSNPAYIDGIFFGPQSRESMEQQRANIPVRYPLEFYPDTAHAMHSQFPVPDWDPIFALTEGREPINPRPAGFEHIYRHFYSSNEGFIVYSEGVNDDVNKVLWGGWGWSLLRSTHDTLRDYARYFFHADSMEEEGVARAIEGLEKNWTGPLLQNARIGATLALLEALHPAASARNWRWDSLLYRGAYDRYVQIKRGRELAAEQSALRALTDGSIPALQRINTSRSILDTTRAGAEEQRLHDELARLAAALYRECGLQLSVKLYGASNWERGANFDRVDTPLNDRTWIEARLQEVETLHGTEQSRRLAEVARWTSPAPGALYDDLGDPANEPHLVGGIGWKDDPQLFHSAINGIADETLERGWRLSWLDYAETLYEQPMQLHYAGLSPGRTYRLRITYAGEEYKLPMELLANGTVLELFRLRQQNPERAEFDLPKNLLRSGELTIEWRRPPGAGGGGRGGQVAEVWLIPQP